MKKSIQMIAVILGLSLLCGCSPKSTEETKKKKNRDKEKISKEEEDESETIDPSEKYENKKYRPDIVEDNGNCGDPSRDSDAGKISRELYTDALNCDQMVDVSYLLDCEFESVVYEDYDIQNTEMNLEDIANLFYNHLRSGNLPKEPDVEYGYFDAGEDGDPELLITISALDDYQIMLLIKNIDGELVLIDALESYYYSGAAMMNNGIYGYSVDLGVEEGLEMYTGYYDADLNYHPEVYEGVRYRDFYAFDEKLSALDDYAAGLSDKLIVRCLVVEEDEPVYFVCSIVDYKKLDEEGTRILTELGFTVVDYDKFYEMQEKPFKDIDVTSIRPVLGHEYTGV